MYDRERQPEKKAPEKKTKAQLLAEEQQKYSLMPRNHSFTPKSTGGNNEELCFWCGEPLNKHRVLVSCHTGERLVLSRTK